MTAGNVPSALPTCSDTVAAGLKLITLEIVLGFGVPVAWGVWQLVELRRLKKQDEAREAQERARPAPPGDARPSPPPGG